MKIICGKLTEMKELIVNFVNEEYKTVFVSYHDRIVDCYKNTWIMYIIFFVGFTIASDFVFALCLIIFLLLVNTIEYRRWAQGYISRVNKNGVKLEIGYFIKDKEYFVEDDAITFQFEKRRVWYKINGGSPFLQINHQGNVMVKQFTIGDIDEAVIDKIVDEFG